MVASLVLASSDSNKLFIVETDTSDFAVGAVLLQFGNNNLEHPVAFYFRKSAPC